MTDFAPVPVCNPQTHNETSTFTMGHNIAAICSRRRNGPNVVFMPGILTGVSFWPSLLPNSIAETMRWASLSLPCHFPSTAPNDFTASDVTAELFSQCLSTCIRNIFDGEPVHLVGWSTGGFAAFALAGQHPELVTSVTAISGFARGKWGSLPGLLQHIARAGRIGRFVFKTDLRLMARFPRLLTFLYSMLASKQQSVETPPLSQWIPGMRECIARSNATHLSYLFAGMRQIDISHTVQQIQCPSLIIAGEQDRVIRMNETRYLSSLLREHDKMQIEKCGHLFFWECPEKIWPRLSSWINAHH